MQFTNATELCAKMLTGSTGDTEMLCLTASKATYAIQEGALTAVDPDEAWPVFDKPFVFEGVTLAADLDFRKSGTDVLVFGKATAPGRGATRRMRVAIESGSLHFEVEVFGDRVWRRGESGLTASAPKPFIEMPLTCDRAFGGKTPWDGMEMPHHINPDGTGFALSEEDAEGKPLPNLELPDCLISDWSDLPRPACFYRPAGWLEDRDATELDPEALPLRIIEGGFNNTVPELIVAPEDLADSILLRGFTPEGEWKIPTPPVHGPTAHVSVGSLRGRFPSTMSSLVILASQRVVVVTYLCMFRYLFRPMEQRHMELRWGEDRAADNQRQGVAENVGAA